MDKLATDKQLKYLQALLRDNRDLTGKVSDLAGISFDKASLTAEHAKLLTDATSFSMYKCSKVISKCIDVNDNMKLTVANLSKISGKLEAKLTEGIWYRDCEDGKTGIEIWKVEMPPSGYPYCKRLNPTNNKFEYQAGKQKYVLANCKPLTVKAAKKFGKFYGVCAMCGKTLTVEASVEAGIGPVCQSKLS